MTWSDAGSVRASLSSTSSNITCTDQCSLSQSVSKNCRDSVSEWQCGVPWLMGACPAFCNGDQDWMAENRGWRPRAGAGVIGEGTASLLPSGFRAEPRPPKGCPLLSAVRKASPDTIILLIVDYRAAIKGGGGLVLANAAGDSSSRVTYLCHCWSVDVVDSIYCLVSTSVCVCLRYSVLSALHLRVLCALLMRLRPQLQVLVQVVVIVVVVVVVVVYSSSSVCVCAGVVWVVWWGRWRHVHECVVWCDEISHSSLVAPSVISHQHEACCCCCCITRRYQL